MRLQWGASDMERLQEINSALKDAIISAPCLISTEGELTYECRIESPCRVCRWRIQVTKSLREEYDEVL